MTPKWQKLASLVQSISSIEGEADIVSVFKSTRKWAASNISFINENNIKINTRINTNIFNIEWDIASFGNG